MCGGVVRPSGAGRWHSRTRAYSRRGGARTRSLSSAARPVGHPVRARVNFFRAGASAGARLLRHTRALLPLPPELPLGCAGGAGVEGVLFPWLTPLPSFCCGYWSSKKKGVAGGAAGCVGGTRTSALRSPVRTPARRPPRSRRTHSQKFPSLRFAFALKMARVPPHQTTHVPVPRPFSFLLPLFFPHSF